MRARKSGNLAASRALLRALATQQPDLPQVWLVLATVAETRAEQRHALEQVLALGRSRTCRINKSAAARSRCSPTNGGERRYSRIRNRSTSACTCTRRFHI